MYNIKNIIKKIYFIFLYNEIEILNRFEQNLTTRKLHHFRFSWAIIDLPTAYIPMCVFHVVITVQ